jgi:hypothetical protein
VCHDLPGIGWVIRYGFSGIALTFWLEVVGDIRIFEAKKKPGRFQYSVAKNLHP